MTKEEIIELIMWLSLKQNICKFEIEIINDKVRIIVEKQNYIDLNQWETIISKTTTNPNTVTRL